MKASAVWWWLLAVSLCVAGSAAGQRDQSGPFIERFDVREWRLTATVTILSGRQMSSSLFHLNNQPMSWISAGRSTLEFPVEEGTLYWPLAGEAASYEVDRGSARAKLHSNGWEIPLSRTIWDADASQQPLHSGAAYGIWSFGPYPAVHRDLRMEFSFRANTWNTRFNEALALEVPWPSGEWPAEAMSSFDEMLFIDRDFFGPYTSGVARELAEKYTAGQPRSQPPVVAAKWIAGQLATEVQASGLSVFRSGIFPIKDLSRIRADHMQSLRFDGLDRVARDLTGSPLDFALLLTAIYREIGLPARVVIGYVAGPNGGREELFRDPQKPEFGIYPWVEFALYDERESAIGGSLTWIPVDIISMQQNNTGRRPFDQPWDGFGSSEFLGEVIPLAYHLHPHMLPAYSFGQSPDPLTLADGRVIYEPLPALWGWNLVPAMPCGAGQAVTFTATTPSRRNNDANATTDR
ncbi:MAG: transglutaminase-like domain-containing protein [Planctomycetota bacterium]